ncbi:amidohydrolase [Metarhizium acridum CQMa 102]|uniref:Amidohydrolase n=1 Tax=Metarhizium acridum (strain CQMa 102) TaxID=655827 RepID=E9E7J7_METAQ|nr:amidohydrolase [Metarhizium acridum CQMa 102]EFY88107.1 amidohydrolase [Metarhizium acridum CQMa 102]
MTRRVLEQRPAQEAPQCRGQADAAPFPRSFYSFGLGTTIDPRAGQAASSHASSGTRKLIYTIVKADLLIPGADEPVPDAALVAEAKLIVWVGKQAAIPAKYTEKCRGTYSVPYLMPGLWDCHAHLLVGGDDEASWPAYMSFVAGQPVANGARLARLCWEVLQRGYTSVRDLAGYGCEVAKAVEEGTVPGPNIYGSGACISQLAGHGDVFALPAGDVLLNLGAAQIRRGARCIKLLASGGVMSSDDDPTCAQFSPRELAAVVDEARRFKRSVAAHVHGKPGIVAAVEAGVRTVEHVSLADDECLGLIKQRGVVYVATREAIELLLSMGDELPRVHRDKVRLVAEHHMAAYKAAVRAGVTIALGTDAVAALTMARELEWAVEAGLSNLEAIRAATANGPLTVEGQAPKTGQLKPGYEADFIGVTENPVADVRVLQNKENIRWVWKGGRIFKGPGVGPWGESAAWA